MTLVTILFALIQAGFLIHNVIKNTNHNTQRSRMDKGVFAVIYGLHIYGAWQYFFNSTIDVALKSAYLLGMMLVSYVFFMFLERRIKQAVV